MKVAELMRTDVKTVDLDATVGDAITTLADVHVSALPVIDVRGRIVGVVSTTDILCTLSETTEPRSPTPGSACSTTPRCARS